jgi:hypothetical protein
MRASGHALLRHWQWFVLAALFIPGVPIVSLLALSGQIVSALVAPDGHFLAHFGGLVALDAIAILWILPQRKTLRGGGFANFVSTLPISPRTRRGVDLTVLAFANIPLLIPGAIALMIEARGRSAAALYQSLAVIASFIPLFAAQIAIVGRQAGLLLMAGTADLLLSLSLALPFGIAAWLLLSLSFVVATAALFWAEPGGRPRYRLLLAPTPRLRLYFDRLPLPMRIQAKALAAHPLATALRLGAVLALAVATDALLVAFNFDARALPTAIAALAASAVLLAGLYRMLDDAHVMIHQFLKSLPVRPAFWPWRDTLFVMLLGLVPFGLLLLPTACRGLASVSALALLGLAYAALIAGLRLPLRRQGGLNVILAALIAIGWASAAIAAVLR